MSLPNVTPRNGYLGNGVTDDFFYTFRILDATHLRVYQDDVLQATSTYSITGVDAVGGGTVTFNTAPASGVKVTLSRFTPIDQLTTYLAFEQNDLTAAQAMESAFDKLTMILQELRSLQVPYIEAYSAAAAAEYVDVVHNLNTLEAILLSATADWNVGEITPEVIDEDTIRLHFANQVPGAGGTVNVMVAPESNSIVAQYTGVNDPGLVSLVNRTGTTLAVGEVVGIDTANDSSVVLADTLNTKKQLTVVLDDTIAPLAVGRFIQTGYATVKTTGVVARGNYLVKSATTKRAEDSGTAHGDAVTMPDGTFAIALTASAGGLSGVTALLLGGVLSTQSVLAFGVTPSTQAFGDAAAEGVSANPSRGDHVHAMMTGPKIYAKTADQILTPSNTTLQNLSNLVFPVVANGIYAVKAKLLMNAPGTAADFKFGWTLPAGATIFWASPLHLEGASFTMYWDSASSKALLLTSASTQVVGAAVGTTGVIFEGIVTISSTAGDVQLQAAQNVSVAENDTILAGSFLEVIKLN